MKELIKEEVIERTVIGLELLGLTAGVVMLTCGVKELIDMYYDKKLEKIKKELKEEAEKRIEEITKRAREEYEKGEKR